MLLSNVKHEITNMNPPKLKIMCNSKFQEANNFSSYWWYMIQFPIVWTLSHLIRLFKCHKTLIKLETDLAVKTRRIEKNLRFLFGVRFDKSSLTSNGCMPAIFEGGPPHISSWYKIQARMCTECANIRCWLGVPKLIPLIMRCIVWLKMKFLWIIEMNDFLPREFRMETAWDFHAVFNSRGTN